MNLNPAGRPPKPFEWPPAVQRQNGFAPARRTASARRLASFLLERIRRLFHFRGAEIWFPAILFLLTAMTTLLAGAMQRGFLPGDIWAHPSFLLAGFPFSFTLLLILGAHELGHYFASRAWRVEATLPYFIPAPTLFGTFGAVIRIKSPILSRKALMDVAVAGPLAGMAVALPAVLVGLSMSEVVSPGGGGGGTGLGLGSSLLFKGAVWTAFGAKGLGGVVTLHPVAFAGWCGFLVTSLNLIPAGQLDGGHIVFSLMSRWHRAISNGVGAVLVVMSYWWPGWLLWAAVALFIGRRRHPVWDMEESIGKGRILLGYSCMILMFLTFTWVPLYIH
ncbi:MAG: site-2 protease family protein [Nitrospinota bacterium]|jgi:membrane-associated protease RseP (regulator of RpoE activity)|nr:site-2 protease family protein [Nitrospinota bacterium]MDP7662020.1 site-2 protease family protein [Nitrospinota bacterium]|tara:strand:- start:172 stop:1170 length:999 start_codon:yes stop_codon:yes gene_type:complete